MPTVMYELVGSRETTVSHDSPTLRALYHVVGTDNDAVARALVESLAPATTVVSGVTLTVTDYHAKDIGAGNWEVEVNYGKKAPKKPGLLTIDFEVGGDKTKLTQSLHSTYFPSVGNPAIDYKGAIDERKHGGAIKVEGVEVEIASVQFTISRTFGPAVFPDPSGPPFTLTGTVVDIFNAKAWHVNTDDVDITCSGIALHFDPGCLLFKGVTGSQKNGGGDDWQGEVKMKFGYSPNLVNGTVAGISGINKKGWEYLWVTYEDSVDPTANELRHVPRQVNVEQVYEETTLMELFT